MTKPDYQHPMTATYIWWAIPDHCARWKMQGRKIDQIVDEVLPTVDPPVDTDHYDDFSRFINDVRAQYTAG